MAADDGEVGHADHLGEALLDKTHAAKPSDVAREELLDRLKAQRELPLPQMKVCRGRMFSRIDFEIDVKEWGFADVGGEGELRAGVDEKTLEGGPV